MKVRISRRSLYVVGAILLTAIILLTWPAIVFANDGAAWGAKPAKEQPGEKARNAGVLGVLNQMQDPQVAPPPILESWEVPGVFMPESTPTVFLLSGAQKRNCPKAGTVCVAPSADQPWQVEMVSRFWAASKPVPIIVAVFDTADPESIARKEAKILWDVNMNPGRELGMRFLLAPEDGFEPSHTYLVRVVQAKSKWERILAEGIFHLE